MPADPSEPESENLRCFSIDPGRTKTTEAEEGRAVKLVGRAAEAVVEWPDSEDIEEGYVFRHIDRWENVSARSMSPAGVNHMIKRRLNIAGYDENDYSAHWLRAGYLTQAAKDGVPLPEAMPQSQHRSVQRASNSYNDTEAELGRAVRLME